MSNGSIIFDVTRQAQRKKCDSAAVLLLLGHGMLIYDPESNQTKLFSAKEHPARDPKNK